MTFPLIVALLSLPPYGFLSLHSVWRFIMADLDPKRQTSPMSLIQATFPWFILWFVWHLLQETDPTAHLPQSSAVVLCLFGWFSVSVLHLYEMQQAVPYDGLFPWWRKGKKKKEKPKP